MFIEVVKYYCLRAYFAVVKWCGGTEVLLTDPRWVDPLGPVDLEDMPF